MAKPIKETPVLKGKDADSFVAKIELVKENKATKEEIAKMKENFSKLNSIAKF